MQIKIKNKKIGDNAPVFVIAEIGTNHNGDINLAKRIIKAAAKAKADAVKIQLVNPDESYAKDSPSYRIFRKVSLSFSALTELKKEADRLNIIFFATAGDILNIELIVKLKMPLIKISSGCMTNTLLLREAARMRLPVIMSTGMAYLAEIKSSVHELERNGAKDIALLHCTSSYPAEYSDLNLNSIKTLKDNFKYPIGYSDHTVDNLASLAAVSIGAAVIEKHFTLSRKLRGPEHYFSSEPAEFSRLVGEIRGIKRMMGSYVKMPTEKELKARNTFRRYLVFARKLDKGAVIQSKDIGVKRLNKKAGLSPESYDGVIGRRTVMVVDKDEPVSLKVLR